MTFELSLLVPLYLGFAAKHFLADFPLQTDWMAKGKAAPSDWLKPLAAHAGVHAAGTLLLCLLFAPALWWLAAVDFLLHAAIDRTKVDLTRGWTPGEARFWWAFGLDQTAHQLTHFAFVVAILVQASTIA